MDEINKDWTEGRDKLVLDYKRKFKDVSLLLLQEVRQYKNIFAGKKKKQWCRYCRDSSQHRCSRQQEVDSTRKEQK